MSLWEYYNVSLEDFANVRVFSGKKFKEGEVWYVLSACCAICRAWPNDRLDLSLLAFLVTPHGDIKLDLATSLPNSNPAPSKFHLPAHFSPQQSNIYSIGMLCLSLMQATHGMFPAEFYNKWGRGEILRRGEGFSGLLEGVVQDCGEGGCGGLEGLEGLEEAYEQAGRIGIEVVQAFDMNLDCDEPGKV